MIQSRELQQAHLGLQAGKLAGMDADAQGASLLDRAQEAQAEQMTMLEATPLESQYSAAFAAQVEAKHGQAERIEERLENLIEQQASRLQQTQTRQPSFFAFPGARAKWQNHLQQQKNTMQRLHGRLDVVREIKEGMGVHGPLIDELATRKLHAQEPDLAKGWNRMLEAQRLHEVLLRKQEHEKKQAQEREHCERMGRGLHLGLSQAR